jgi:hypothetical protein
MEDPRASAAPPPLAASRWFNTSGPITLDAMRGRVVLVHAFQMLCPGCVSHALPQAAKVRQTFSEDELALIGLHTVFEHHAVMTPEALEVFLHEYRIGYPVGVDEAVPGDALPATMRAYRLRGTPSLLLFDRAGQLRLNHFGSLDDLALGALIGQLLAEAVPARSA